MEIKKTPSAVWHEYESAKNYNENIGLYETVKQNENFFLGKQWEGLNAPDLDKPVLNFLKRVVSYFIAMIVTDNVGVNIEPNEEDERLKFVCDALSEKVNSAIESTKLVSKNRDILRDAAVDGDACVYCYYEDGGIKVETVDNTRVLFGNRYNADVQSQPFIIVAQPMVVAEVKRIAKRNKVDPDSIRSDYDEGAITNGQNSEDRRTVLVKFWKDDKTGTIHYIKTTKDQILQKETDLGYKLYPIAFMNWEKVKNCYHGQAAITGLIPNQIAVNKLWAMALRHQHMAAFPKVFYDRSKIREWNNRVGEAIGVTGNPNEAIATNFRQADMSQQLVDIVDRTITMTRDFMGASDAALGNVRPDNTSAIIAVQKAAAAPLELQRLSFYQFIEDIVRIMIEIIMRDYPPVAVEQEVIDPMLGTPITQEMLVDLSQLSVDQMSIKIDVGAAAYWSEVTQIQTLDNMYRSGILNDAVLYLESIPDNYIRNKNEIIEKLKEQQQMQQMMQMGGVPNGMPAVQSGAAY